MPTCRVEIIIPTIPTCRVEIIILIIPTCRVEPSLPFSLFILQRSRSMSNSSLINQNLSYKWVSEAFSKEELALNGIVFIVLTLITIIPYIGILYFFICDRTFNKLKAYKIMTYLGFMDIGQLCAYLIMGIMQLCNSNFGSIFAKIAAMLNMTSWLGMILFTFILTINRFDALVGLPFPKSFRQKWLHRILLIISYFLMLVQFISFFIPGYGASMQITHIDYESISNSLQLTQKRSWASIILLSLSAVLYLIAGLSILAKNHLKRADPEAIIAHEIRLFLQAGLICGYKAAVTLLWSNWMPPTKLAYLLFYVFVILESGYIPYMYLAMNRTLRSQIHKKFLNSKQTPIQMISIANYKN